MKQIDQTIAKMIIDMQSESRRANRLAIYRYSDNDTIFYSIVVHGRHLNLAWPCLRKKSCKSLLIQ